MESKLAREAKEALIAATQRLSTEERLYAFLAHSRPMVALFQTGEQIPLRVVADQIMRTKGPGEAALLLLDVVRFRRRSGC
jgi:hypothetical protein